MDRRADGKGPGGQIVWPFHGRPEDRISMPAIHRWWCRIAQEAGLVGRSVTQGLNMHQARHVFAMELRRVVGVEAASQALGPGTAIPIDAAADRECGTVAWGGPFGLADVCFWAVATAPDADVAAVAVTRVLRQSASAGRRSLPLPLPGSDELRNCDCC